MNETVLNVKPETVQTFLAKGSECPFVIPEYQRPYAWEEEQVRTLFEDLEEFTFARMNEDEEKQKPYFLGCIVSFKNAKGEQEIIDGQQRITTIMLLLRAIYYKLEKAEETKTTQNLMKTIVNTIWKTDFMTGEIVNKEQVFLRSEVIGNEGNEILRKILETGEPSPENKDNYSKNYNLLKKMLDDLSQKNPTAVNEFIRSLINKSVLLPIQAGDMEMALTIFSTLNNRGMPLSDADIFKSEIYKKLKNDEKKEFVENWQYLEERANEKEEPIQKLFYYYMFYLRALAKDDNSTTPGVRNYFIKDNEKTLCKEVLQKLGKILDLMVVVKGGDLAEDEWITDKIRTRLDILNAYPNEFWKYPVIDYFLSNSAKRGFSDCFEKFLNNLIRVLISRYLIKPTINAVKNNILKLDVAVINSLKPKFHFDKVEKVSLEGQIKSPNKNIVRMLLKVIAYNFQEELLPVGWEIEHILPRQYQSTYFSNESKDLIDAFIEHIGNKVPIEKKLNIKASNDFFEKKKEKYEKSKISVVKELAKKTLTDWKVEQIEERDKEIVTLLLKLFDKWEKEYEES